MGVKVRSHQVLGTIEDGKDIHALCLLEGDFSGIVFSYEDVSFDEREDALKMNFEYFVHEVPESRVGYDKKAFEKELGDFLVELLYYGLEKDYPLGITDAKD
jgi:hypothetical protein